jgi:mRNA-degrading endonuclease RelE of RelBE toxin-antitoxin system
MAYRFVFTAWFDRNIKSLRKHNPNLRSDFESFLQTFDAEAHPTIPGTGGAESSNVRQGTRQAGRLSGRVLLCS